MNTEETPNEEKIRNLLNKLQGTMPILSRLNKLKYNIPMISFKYYKNHMDTILALSEKDLLVPYLGDCSENFSKEKMNFLITRTKKRVIFV